MEIRGIVLFLDANYTNYTDVFLCDDLRNLWGLFPLS